MQGTWPLDPAQVHSVYKNPLQTLLTITVLSELMMYLTKEKNHETNPKTSGLPQS